MSALIDTNVLLDLVAGDLNVASRAASILDEESGRGGLFISPPVYAECLAHPGWRQRDLDELLRDTKVTVIWQLSQEVWVSAGLALSLFAKRRRRDSAEQPRRLLVDFVIGAHAMLVGGIITRDKFYSKYFPRLRVIEP